MALLKGDNYNSLRIETGNSDVDGEMGDQLQITQKELTSAINAENVTDKIFARILTNRSMAHQKLMAAVPGATSKP